ncbi:MAG: amylo-alpha-1,6-glucosidase [Sulfuriferula sp.]
MTCASRLPEWIRFGREVCNDLAQAERREWWLTNGRGAYAAGTIAGTLTRRYHGLLVAPIDPPLGRSLLFAKADATLLDGNYSWPLYSNRWGEGDIDPAGYLHIESFYLEGRMPVWRFACGDVVIEQRIWMEHGKDTTCIAWRRLAGGSDRPLSLHVALLANARDFHAVSAPGAFAPTVTLDANVLHVEQPERFRLSVGVHGGRIEQDATWIEHFNLSVEHERGLEDQDNHLRVGIAHLELLSGNWCGVVGSLSTGDLPNLEESMLHHQNRDASLLSHACAKSPALNNTPAWIDQLVLAADSFIIARPLPDLPDAESVIAGYPWFGEWGRDTMIALPGLTLATGRYDTAKHVLEAFTHHVDQGMLPNWFPSPEQTPQYNTADASLWFIEAWRAYVEVTGDSDSLARAMPALTAIIAAHRIGARHGISEDPADGLLRAGEPGLALTWMDARFDGHAFTPRIGKPVEINALWYNALRSMANFNVQLGLNPQVYASLADRVATSFTRFTPADGDALFDVIDGPDGNDASLRPNQILAVSLRHSALDANRQRSVVAVCGRYLLTSYGLRTLAPNDPRHQPYYQGGVVNRDNAYHQGTAWTWLLGHYALAEYRVTGDAKLAQFRLTSIADHLRDAGLGSVSEIFDSAPPHTPRGAPAQAWSVACVLEAWCRLEHIRRAGNHNRHGNHP